MNTERAATLIAHSAVIGVVALVQASLFRHGIFRNPVTLYGVSVSVAVMVLVVYAPFLQVRSQMLAKVPFQPALVIRPTSLY